MKELSVIIVTYNSEPDIYGCLEALFAHNDLGEALEVIVVDNNSSCFAHMRDELKRLYGDKVKVCSNKQNGGYGQGNNIGIKHATSPVIMIMNPDVRWEKGSFKTIVQAYQTSPTLAMCGFKQVTMQGDRALSFCYTNCSSAIEKSLGTFIANRLEHYQAKKMCLAGACFCIRKAMMETIGGFDEQIFLYAEENDIHYRMHEHFPQAFSRYNPQMVYRHRCENRAFSENSWRQQIESNLYVCQKRHIAPARYLQTEIGSMRIVRLLKRLSGNTANLPVLDKKLAIIRSYT